MSANANPLRILNGLRLVIFLAASVIPFVSASGNAQVVIEGSRNGSGGSVVIDQGVLDSLGPPPAGAITPLGQPVDPLSLVSPPTTGSVHPAPSRRVAAGPPSWAPPLPGRRPVQTVAEVPEADSLPAEVAPPAPPVAGSGSVEPPRPADGDVDTLPSPAVPPPGVEVVGDRPATPDLPEVPTVTVDVPPRQDPPAASDPVEPPTEPEVGSVEPPLEPAILIDRPPEPTGPAPELTPRPDPVPADRDVAAAAPVDPAPAEDEEAVFSIAFAGVAAELAADALPILDRLAARMQADPALRVDVLSYAGGTPETASEARSLSLTRALAVRDYLEQRDIRRTRIDVRALGNTAPDGPADRIDLIIN